MMTAKLRSWWQHITQHFVSLLVVALILVVAIALIIVGYQFDGTGFKGKTLWDWLQFLTTLAIPLVVVYASARLNHDLTIARDQREASRQDTQDQQRQDTLQSYLSKMSELSLNKNLSSSTKTGMAIRALIRAWTLLASRVLDPYRKGILLQFLNESGLINQQNPIVDLRWADFSRIELSNAILSETTLLNVDLRKAILSNADFSQANLTATDLSGANLKGANFEKATLISVNFSGAHLENAIFTDSDLSSAILSLAILTRANLRNADLTNSNLREANLRGANLREATLSGNETNPNGADLSGADLSGADLSEAVLDEVDLKELERKAKSLEGAIMPNGSKHP